MPSYSPHAELDGGPLGVPSGVGRKAEGHERPEMSSTRVLVSVSPGLNGSKPAGASLRVGVVRLRGVTPPPRPIGRCRCIGRRIVRSRIGSGVIRSSQRTGDDATDDRWCPPTAAPPTAAATMTLRLRYAGGANHDSRAQSDGS